jgi:hypothetical protein
MKLLLIDDQTKFMKRKNVTRGCYYEVLEEETHTYRVLDDNGIPVNLYKERFENEARDS